jgi:hypothetical protein
MNSNLRIGSMLSFKHPRFQREYTPKGPDDLTAGRRMIYLARPRFSMKEVEAMIDKPKATQITEVEGLHDVDTDVNAQVFTYRTPAPFDAKRALVPLVRSDIMAWHVAG